MSSLLLSLYRGFQTQAVQKLLLPRVFPESHLKRLQEKQWQKLSPGSSVRLWVHGASVGEWESLFPVMNSLSGFVEEWILTYFSPSAEKTVRSLQERFGKNSKVLYAGVAPWEGEWKEALEKTNPRAFVTAKYEAWPELWASLAEKEIPLFMVGARSRTSLKTAAKLSRVFGVSPQLHLGVDHEDQRQKLESLFKGSDLRVFPDPRWDRVFERVETRSQAKERVERISDWAQICPRPWGVLSQVGKEDLRFWKSHLKSGLRGTLWVVPHDTEEKDFEALEEELRSYGLSTIRSTQSSEPPRGPVILVNERGILTELYRLMDWVYVGGGWKEGVHNTIEPSVYGLPIAIGPKGADRFSEIEILRNLGQLELLQTENDLGRWVEKRQKEEPRQQQWLEQLSTYKGGATRYGQWIREVCNG